MTDRPPADEREWARPVPAATLAEAFDRFARLPSPALLLGQVVAVGAARARHRGVDRGDAALGAAIVAGWPVMEWLAHKHVLHARPRRIAGREVDPAVARHHRLHHAEPWNPRHTVLPPWFILPAVPLHAALWLALPVSRRRALSGMLALSTAALAYEWTHFLTHTAYRPRRSWYRRLQRRHRLHHFKHEQHWFGFTVPFVDDLAGTAPDPATLETSPTVRTLGVTDPGD